MAKDKHLKFVATAATAVLVASAVVPVSASTSDAKGEYQAAVDYVLSTGIAKGIGNSLFGVHDPIKRGDLAVMVAKALNLDVENAPASKFTDLNARVKGSVNALYATKIVNGKTATNFAPDDYVTRAELAKILTNAYGLSAGTVKNSFTDVNSNCAPYVNALVNSGLTKGISSTKFGSSLHATRGQFALFLYRAKDLRDSEAPVLKYEGQATLNVSYGAKFDLPVVTATDNVDEKVNVTFVIKDSAGNAVDKVDTSKPGTYTITYSAVDSAGNKAKELVITVVVANPVVVTPTPPTPPVQDPTFKLSIMHTNDTHAHLDNVAKRITAIKEVRKAKPNALLLDAGDVFSGTLYFNEFKGLADMEFMNMAGYDAMTFGNHEFDLGTVENGNPELAEFVKKAKFPFVSSNVDFSADSNFNGLYHDGVGEKPANGEIYHSIIKTINGEKVGIFGLTTEDTKDIASPGNVTFKDYIESAQKAVDELEKKGINKIIALTHLGFDDNPAIDNDLELAKYVDGIDVIVGGHSHTELKAAVKVNKDENGKVKAPTVIVQAYQYSDYLGTVDVTFDKNGKVVANTSALVSVATKAEDPEAAEALKKYSDVIKELKSRETGATAVNALENPRTNGDNSKPSVRKNETPLGNLITDGMLAKAKTFDSSVIMALQNGGGIRAPINQGPITVGEIIEVLPFGNTLATMKISGAELKEAFEISFKDYPIENGGFLHVSGAKIEFDSSKPVGQRVVSVKYMNDKNEYVEIQKDGMYTIATNAFTAKGGDNFTVFKKIYDEGRVTDLGLSDWENLEEHVKKIVNVDPKVEGRIVDVAGNSVPEPEEPQNIDDDHFSGEVGKQTIYDGDVIVTMDSVYQLAYAIVNGNLTIKGDLKEVLSFHNLTIKGNLILTDLNGDVLNFDGIEVEGETIF